MKRQMAIVRCTRSLIESLLGPGETLSACSDKVGAVDFGFLERALILPANAKINGVSIMAYFDTDDVAVRIECPDFVETEPACRLPTVTAVYESRDGKGVFVRWTGEAVEEPVPQECAQCGNSLWLFGCQVGDDKTPICRSPRFHKPPGCSRNCTCPSQVLVTHGCQCGGK